MDDNRYSLGSKPAIVEVYPAGIVYPAGVSPPGCQNYVWFLYNTDEQRRMLEAMSVRETVFHVLHNSKSNGNNTAARNRLEQLLSTDAYSLMVYSTLLVRTEVGFRIRYINDERDKSITDARFWSMPIDQNGIEFHHCKISVLSLDDACHDSEPEHPFPRVHRLEKQYEGVIEMWNRMRTEFTSGSRGECKERLQKLTVLQDEVKKYASGVKQCGEAIIREASAGQTPVDKAKSFCSLKAESDYFKSRVQIHTDEIDAVAEEIGKLATELRRAF